MKRTAARRIVAFLSVLTIAMILASLTFVALESGHECHHEDCHICAAIFQCDNAFRSLGSTLLQLVVAAFAVATILQFLSIIMAVIADALTPVSSKVRLND